ncbi:hypothetical protein ACFWIY_25985 [Streptomyces sioyaensis]|uniref:hypothetical protein n=1 Tax=Streptomyces sioyaensis TaxID=67364 RepID=UPI003646253D
MPSISTDASPAITHQLVSPLAVLAGQHPQQLHSRLGLPQRQQREPLFVAVQYTTERAVMAYGRVIAAKFIPRELPEPHETQLGGEDSHDILNRSQAHQCTPPGHRIS